MTKNVLLAATAVSVMAFAGAASAHTLSFRTIAAPSPLINATDTGGISSPYKLALESSVATPTFGTFALTAELSAGSQFPSGNNFVQIDLVGGTFDSNLSSAAVVAAGCTSVLSSGGAAGSTTAKFLVSSSGGGGCTAANLDLPIKPNAGAEVSVTTTLSTEAGAPIDPPAAATLKVLSRVDAFKVVFDSAIGGGALGDTFATLTVNPVYTTFKVGADAHAGGVETATTGQLGTIRLVVDTTAHKDLAKNKVVVGDVTEAGVTIDGNFNAFDGAGGSAALGTAMAFNASKTQASLASSLGVATSLTGGAVPFIVTRETTPVAIPTSTYKASVSYKLDAASYNQEGPALGDLESIGRDGTNVVFPWMNSTAIQGATGTSNIIRLGNIAGSATGPVYAQVLNSVNAGAGYTPAAAPVQVFPSIAANGERVINTATLTTALGEFGRGDVQISVEAPSNTVTARRYATLANGSVTELNSGTVASDQNQLNVP
ncbi:hypothetical protein [Brevundimonas sp.]|uniref:hypothetical protein n=1 Tax=Brevundimonas sp. TaxID=1871086 RepID=UPI0028A9768E|nr:hypothetical protein [Brevundimonas sp.]